jgi:uncharacterized protein (TIGR00730 family)
MSFRVCVFCGSRVGRREAYRADSEALGRGIAERGWTVVYGGGEVGLMGVVARAALAAGGSVVGVIPRRLMEREAGKRNLSELRVTETMFERKEGMIVGADAFVALPGGLGTLDELLEVVTLRQLGYHAGALLLVDTEGYWSRYGALVDHVIDEGFAEASARALYRIVPTPAAALEALAARD